MSGLSPSMSRPPSRSYQPSARRSIENRRCVPGTGLTIACTAASSALLIHTEPDSAFWNSRALSP